MKQIVFRTDSSTIIGSGHLMRCLTLAKKLAEKAEITFICRNLSGNMSNMVTNEGFKLHLLENVRQDEKLTGYELWLTVNQITDAEQTKKVLLNRIVDCLIVDSYALDIKWEQLLRPLTKKIMIIDDLANRKHDCDLLLDQNYNTENNRYEKLVPDKCKLLLGTKYVLLREEFYKARDYMRTRNGVIKNIIIFFGGSDNSGATIKTLKVIKLLNIEDIEINVIVGGSNKLKDQIQNICDEKSNLNFYCQIDNISELMNKADLAIGAGGTTTWERSFLGLPAIVLALAENQIENCEKCAQIGLIKYLGLDTLVSEQDIYEALTGLLENKELVKKMSKDNLLFMREHEKSIDKYILVEL